MLVDTLDLDLHGGFCAITGETGAGKSILLEAILFCFGKKQNTNPVRPTTETCTVTLVFCNTSAVVSCLSEHILSNIQITEDCAQKLVLECRQNIQGRRKYFVNNHLVTAKLVSQLFDCLVEVHGQHSHTMLRNSSMHTRILDSFGHLHHLTQEVAKLSSALKCLEQEVQNFHLQQEQIEQEIDYLRHVCHEIATARIIVGEEQLLTNQKKAIQHHKKEESLILSILADITSTNITEVIIRCQRALNKHPSPSNTLDVLCTELDVIYDNIEKVKLSLKQTLDTTATIASSSASIDELDNRLYHIKELSRKYACHSDDLVSILAKYNHQLATIEQKIQTNIDNKQVMNETRSRYFALASTLSIERKKCATLLCQKILDELTLLGMTQAKFHIEITSLEGLISANGIDQIQFLFSTNPGMTVSTIDKIASGGELSRMMLALRVALLDSIAKPIIIFDEIDTGMSGAVADAIGQRLKILGKAVQTIVVTHQPQVAGQADQHVLITKQYYNNHTVSRAQTLDDPQHRTYELARMISGRTITIYAIKAAEQLLQ